LDLCQDSFLRAAEDDIFAFVKMQIQSIGRWQNFGDVSIEVINDHHLCVHYDDHSSSLLSLITRAVYEGARVRFDPPPTVTCEVRSDTDYTIHIRLDA